MSTTWKTTTPSDPEQLAHARMQLHQAAQIAAAVGRTYNTKVKDDHFASFIWNPNHDVLQGHVVEANENFTAALNIPKLSIDLISGNDQIISSFELEGKTQKQALIWLEEHMVKLGLDGSILSIKLPYEIPVYPTSKGQEFHVDDTAYLLEISKHFSNANLILNEVVQTHENASPISCWPHHFDIASLITLNDTGDPETSTSIGVGMSPGDEGYNEPYYYLTPWPYPNVHDLPEIKGPGKWHTDSWVGGVLESSRLNELSGTSEQQMAVGNFVKNGISALSELLTK